MRLFPAIAAFTILLGFTPAAADDGPLAPAREGKIWCYEPDSENKTCGSFSRSEWDVNGDVWGNPPDFGGDYRSTFKTFYGKKFCITLSPYNSIFITEVSMDGTPYPSAASRLKWVSPGDGYALEK
jgi:hypothetical protein